MALTSPESRLSGRMGLPLAIERGLACLEIPRALNLALDILLVHELNLARPIDKSHPASAT